MVNRPNDYDITIPTGADSPRSGDDEIRKIKEYQQNAWRDIHATTGVGITRPTTLWNYYHSPQQASQVTSQAT